MRKQFVLLLLILTYYCAYSQNEDVQSFDKKLFVGGNLNFNTSNNGALPFQNSFIDLPIIFSSSGSRRTSFSFSPCIGGRQNENWSFGLGAGFTFSKISESTSLIGNEVVNSNITFSGVNFYTFGRYTMNSPHKLKVFLQPSLGVGLRGSSVDLESSNLPDPNDINYAEVYASLGAGLLYQVHPKFRFTLNLGNFSALLGKMTVSDTEFEENYDSVGFNFGTQSLRLGGEYIF